MSIYEVCITTGIILSIIFLFIGSLFNETKFKSVLLNIFLIVFGGAGILIEKSNWFSNILSLVISALIGILISLLVYKLLIIPLKKAESTTVMSEKNFIGLDAEVQLKTSDKNIGQIKFIVNGIIMNSPARASTSTIYSAGEKVVIIDIKDNVFIIDKV